MLMPLLFMLILFVLTVSPADANDKRDSHSARFGDLAITLTAMESTEAETHKEDRHSVAVFVTVKNTGHSAVCVTFQAKLEATYGLTYSGQGGGGVLSKFPPAPKIYEMLPGEESSGSYIFYGVKDGVKPLEIILKPLRKTLHCGSSKPTGKEMLLPEELRFDLRDLPKLKRPQPPPTPPF